jgi:hypothetical protein
MLGWKQEEERQRRLAEEEARKERHRLEAETRQKEKEEREKLEAARFAEESAALAAQEAHNPLAAFIAQEALQQARDDAEAQRQITEDAIRESIVGPRQVTTYTAPPSRAAGTACRKTWKHRITDLSIVPLHYLLPNDQLLAATARSTKAPSQIPGVEFYEEMNITGGR